MIHNSKLSLRGRPRVNWWYRLTVTFSTDRKCHQNLYRWIALVKLNYVILFIFIIDTVLVEILTVEKPYFSSHFEFRKHQNRHSSKIRGV